MKVVDTFSRALIIKPLF